MENVTSSEPFQPTEHGLFTQHGVVLSRIISLLAQSILFGAFAVTYGTARSVLKHTGVFLSVDPRNIVYLRAITAMLGFAFAILSVNLMVTLLPAAGYEGKLDTTYGKFADRYFLFLSVNGIQFYLYVTQTAIADGLLTYILYLKSNGNPKAYSHAVVCSILGTLFGYSAFVAPLWALQFLVFTTLAINLMSSGPMMQAFLRDSDIIRDWEWRPGALASLLRSQEFYDAFIQSAAMYSIASFSLLVTFFVDTNILFFVNMSILSPLMGIAFSLVVINLSHSAPNDANQPYLPWTGSRPSVPETGYMSLTAPLERGPDLTFLL